MLHGVRVLLYSKRVNAVRDSVVVLERRANAQALDAATQSRRIRR